MSRAETAQALAQVVDITANSPMISKMLDGVYVGPLGYLLVRLERAAINGSSVASDPGGLALSHAMLRRLSPWLYPNWRHPGRMLRWLVGPSMAEVYWIQDVLIHGDSRAAIVMSAHPLLVAAYTDELDCIALLRFPEDLGTDFDLREGSRLLTVMNCYCGRRLARDLTQGPASYRRCTNFQPFIAEFLSESCHEIEERKEQISEREWDRTQELAERYLCKYGPAARDGCPPRSWIPAAVA